MYLQNLCPKGVRNLSSTKLVFSSKFNLFVGDNGCGKSSILEAVYLLGVGRSFRAPTVSPVISFGEKECSVAGVVAPGISLGVEKSSSGGGRYQVSGQTERSISSIAKLLPLQLIHADSHLLVAGGPQERRKFIDWGVFHVEPGFSGQWRQLKRALLQRNAILKKIKTSRSNKEKNLDLKSWELSFLNYAQQVDAARKTYIELFTPVLLGVVKKMLGLAELEIKYYKGWKSGESLESALAESWGLDSLLGHTTCGPHRAELLITLRGVLVKRVLSRGQLKLFVAAMFISRAKLLQEIKQSTGGIFLVDDLMAELDPAAGRVFLEHLADLGGQALITGVLAGGLKDVVQDRAESVFHVEHGKVKDGGI